MKKVGVIGSINWDVTIYVDHIGNINERVIINKVVQSPGGSGGNVAVATCRLLKPKQVVLIGAVGKDSIGIKQREILENEGVDVSGVIMLENVPSGQAYIIVDKDGNNMLYILRGANEMLSSKTLIDYKVENILEDVSIMVLTNPPLDTIEYLIEKYECLRIWAPGIYATTLNMVKAEQILKRIDILVLNEFEAKSMLGSEKPNQAYQRLKEIGAAHTLIIKLGKNGAVAINENSLIQMPGLDLKKLGLNVVNTTGCGDAFLGGFCAALASDKDLETALKWGNLCGGLKAAKAETRGSPRIKELMDIKTKYDSII
ncbi:MAG: PfkB family carbohydrate kinase [Candidatus Korarchaeota archaeon]